MTKIPFLDLVTPHAELEEQLVAVFRSAVKTAGFIGGPMVEGFEREFAEFCDARYCVGVGSGTDALRFALMAAGCETGRHGPDCRNHVHRDNGSDLPAGASPDFVDIDDQTYRCANGKLGRTESQCARAMNGAVYREPSDRRSRDRRGPGASLRQMADMDAILEIADPYN